MSGENEKPNKRKKGGKEAEQQQKVDGMPARRGRNYTLSIALAGSIAACPELAAGVAAQIVRAFSRAHWGGGGA
jgi:hypothetical protein